MTILRNTLSCTILAGAILFAGSGTKAQDAKPSFTLALSAKTYEFRAGSEASIVIIQKNTSGQTIDCSFQGYGGVNHKYHYDVRDEDGKLAEKAVRPNMELEPEDYHPCNLPPGETSSQEITLSRVYKLDRPGKYTVQVFRFDPGLTDEEGNPLKVLSNTITITVVAADPAPDTAK